MNDPLQSQDDSLYVSTVEHLGPEKNSQKDELNHNNILDASEDVDLNDDDSSAPVLTSQQDFSAAVSPLEQPVVTTMDPGPIIETRNNNERSSKPISSNGQPDDRYIEVSVLEASKIGDGMGAYLVYKILTKTNLGFFKKSEFGVTRRFSDFLGLYEKLIEKHLPAGRIVPPAPEKNVVGMTKVKLGKEEPAGDEFVERRRHALERFLHRVSKHPVLVTDPDFREFLELEGDLPKSTHTMALSSNGVLKLFSKVNDTVSKITFKMDEQDPWFDDKTAFIENLDIQLRKLQSSLDFMVQQRRELAQNSGSFARSAAMLGNCEEHTGLSRCLSKLSELYEKVEQTQAQQANNDFFLMAELLKDYIGLVGAIKEAFHQRIKVYQTWQHALQTFAKKKEALARYELASRSERLPLAKSEVEEWEAKVQRGEEEFKTISKVIKQEVESFEVKRIEEFKNSILNYMECLLETQQKLAQHWESFLPEAKDIAE